MSRKTQGGAGRVQDTTVYVTAGADHSRHPRIITADLAGLAFALHDMQCALRFFLSTLVYSYAYSGANLGLRRTPLRVNTPLASATADLLRADQDRAVAARAVKERDLLQQGTDLPATKQRRGGGGGGMGMGPVAKPSRAKSKVKAKSAKVAKAAKSTLAMELDTHGVIRINAALSEATADAMRDFVDAEKLRGEQEVAAGTHTAESRFADLVLVKNRCDVLLPLRGAAIDALQVLLHAHTI